MNEVTGFYCNYINKKPIQLGIVSVPVFNRFQKTSFIQKFLFFL